MSEIEPKYNIDPENTVMVIVDPQVAFGKVIPVPDAQNAAENMQKATDAWRNIGGEVIITKHIIEKPDDTGRLEDFVPHAFEVLSAKSEATKLYDGLFQDGDLVIEKDRFNAFIRTNLEKELRDRFINLLVIAGLTTPVCVEGTVKGANERDFKVIVLEDACASQALGRSPEQSHDDSILEMGSLWAEIISTNKFIERVENFSPSKI